jgi:hypothetical protein
MKPVEWKTYRTRFLIKAKQLSSSLSFVDHLGRQHCGRKGDYLVESSDGVLSIAPRRIFEDIYVPMSLTTSLTTESASRGPIRDESPLSESSNESAPTHYNFEPLEIEEVKLGKPPLPSRQRQQQLIARHDAAGSNAVRSENTRPDTPDEPARVRRKLPQPCRLRPSSSGFRLM